MGGKGKGKESNEEAMFRMMGGKDKGQGKDRGKGGKGGKSGKGRKGGGPPSLDEIPEERRKVLSDLLEDFARSPEKQLELPPNLTGLERKFVHSHAEELGMTSQSFGKGHDRHICVFRPEGAAAGGAAEAGAAAGPQQDEGSGGAKAEEAGSAGQDHDEEQEVDLGPVQYSAVILDLESQTRLRAFAHDNAPVDSRSSSSPHRDMHCEHMTICVGPLTEPKTEDNRSVADVLRKQTAMLRPGQELDLKVVSIGRSDEAMAVGVVDCASCNKNPHITISTPPGAPPRKSNDIRKWDLLPPSQQITLHGMVWQRGGRRAAGPATWRWKNAAAAAKDSPVDAAALADVALEGAVQLARAVLAAERGGRPKSEKALRIVLDRRAIPRSLYAVHPAMLVQALGSAVPNKAEVLRRLEASLGPPVHDPLDLCLTPRAPPKSVVERVRVALAVLLKRGLSTSELQLWLVSQASCPSGLNAETVVRGLVESGAVRLGEDGSVEYLALGGETKADALHHLPYSRPWPLKKEAKLSAEEEGG